MRGKKETRKRVAIFELWGHARTSRELTELVLAPDLRALCRWALVKTYSYGMLYYVLPPRHIHVLWIIVGLILLFLGVRLKFLFVSAGQLWSLSEAAVAPFL